MATTTAMPPLGPRKTGQSCRALPRCVGVPVLRALADLVPKTKHPHTPPWKTAREAQIPPLSVDGMVPPCPAPTSLGTLVLFSETCASRANPLGGSPRDASYERRCWSIHQHQVPVLGPRNPATRATRNDSRRHQRPPRRKFPSRGCPDRYRKDGGLSCRCAPSRR